MPGAIGLGAGRDDSKEPGGLLVGSDEDIYCIQSKSLPYIARSKDPGVATAHTRLGATDDKLQLLRRDHNMWLSSGSISCVYMAGPAAEKQAELDVEGRLARQLEKAKQEEQRAAIEHEKARAWILGRQIYVRDDPRQPWTRGVVEGHGSEGQPLVRPMCGWPKAISTRVGDTAVGTAPSGQPLVKIVGTEIVTVFGAEESAEPRRWTEVCTTPPGLTLTAVFTMDCEHCWVIASHASGHDGHGAVLAAIARLLLWGIGRFVCGVYLLPTYDLSTSWVLPGFRTERGVILLLVLEGASAVLVLLCCWVNPGYLLLFNFRASLRESTAALHTASFAHLSGTLRRVRFATAVAFHVFFVVYQSILAATILAARAKTLRGGSMPTCSK